MNSAFVKLVDGNMLYKRMFWRPDDPDHQSKYTQDYLGLLIPASLEKSKLPKLDVGSVVQPKQPATLIGAGTIAPIKYWARFVPNPKLVEACSELHMIHDVPPGRGVEDAAEYRPTIRIRARKKIDLAELDYLVVAQLFS